MAPGGIDQAFQFIQEYTGVVVRYFSRFYIGVVLEKKLTKQLFGEHYFLYLLCSLSRTKILGCGKWFGICFPTLPWMDQMGYTAILTMLLIIAVSLLQNKGENDSKVLH
jgi:SSS family solute:Na+ symporter